MASASRTDSPSLTVNLNPTQFMKIYTTPSLNVFGSVETLTAFEGDRTQRDVLVNSRGATIATGLGSIDACTETSGNCLADVTPD